MLGMPPLCKRGTDSMYFDFLKFPSRWLRELRSQIFGVCSVTVYVLIYSVFAQKDVCLFPNNLTKI